MANQEPVRWITVNGKHVPIYEGESNADALDRAFGKKNVKVGDKEVEVSKKLRKTAKELNDMSDEEFRNYVMEQFIDQNSYFKSPEYRELSDQLKQAGERKKQVNQKFLQAMNDSENGYNEEDYKKLVEELGGNKQLARMLAEKTPEGKAAEKRAKELYEEQHSLEERIEELQAHQASIKKNAARKQRTEYINDFENTVSRDVKDNYEGFQFDTGTSDGEDIKKHGGQIVEMSPEQYLHECAHNVFKDTTYENQVLVTAADAKVTKELVGLIESGTKMYLPYLDYRRDQQEGRHRAMAAMLLGIDRIPVLIRRKD